MKEGNWMPKLSETSVRDPVSEEKDSKPFWNKYSAVVASHLTLPISPVCTGSDMILSEILSENPLSDSWFSARFFCHPNQSLPEIYSVTCDSFPAVCTEPEVIVSKLIRLSPLPLL
jgi:hypothetical protein